MRFERELRAGGLLLAGVGADAQPGGYGYAVAAKGAKFGSAEAEKSIAKAFGGRGSRVSVEHYGNAETVLMVEITAGEPVTLARGQADLERVLPNGSGDTMELLWRPHPDAPAEIRDVVYAELVEMYDDLSEARLVRVFQLTLTHKPFVRAQAEVQVPDLGPSGGNHVNRTISVAGTAPSSLALRVASRDGSSDLDDVLVHVSTVGWNPFLTPALLSVEPGVGGWLPLGGAWDSVSATLDVASVPPGSYAILARVRAPLNQDVRLAADVAALPPGATVKEAFAWFWGRVSLKVPSVRVLGLVPTFVTLGVASMPPGDLGAGTVTIGLSSPDAGVEVSDLWALPVCSTSSTVLVRDLERSRLWARPGDGISRLRVGDSVEASGANPLYTTSSSEELRLAPGDNYLHVWTNGGVSPHTSGTYFPHYRGHVVDEGGA